MVYWNVTATLTGRSHDPTPPTGVPVSPDPRRYTFVHSSTDSETLARETEVGIVMLVRFYKLLRYL